MSSRRNSLSPPERRDTTDPGAHELGWSCEPPSPCFLPHSGTAHGTLTPSPAEASDSEEHYSDAQSGPASPGRASPIPRTRVERVDDKPAYGEVPGTQAYRLREGDAEPDEIAIIPDPSEPLKPESELPARSPTPGGHPIPKTVVEETPDTPGSVTHPENRQRRLSDARPDLVVKADGHVEEGGEANDISIPPSSSLSTPTTPARARRKSSLASNRSPLSPGLPGPGSAVSAEEDGDDDDFGDDFDDFEEGGEDGDFDDFDDGFQQAEQTPAPPPPPPPAPATPAAPSLPFPIPTLDDLTPSEIDALAQPYLAALFPPTDPFPPLPSPSARNNPIFLTPRSASLWSQLVAPPPLQPPDWIRSRIRRLFLVSLGVPVDLDEILPASKQKKLVLPSLRRTTSSGSFGRASSDSRGAGKSSGAAASSSAADGENRNSASSSTSQPDDPSNPNPNPKPKKLRRADTAPANPSTAESSSSAAERDFDLVSARQACTLTDAALSGMTDAELRAHVGRLEAMRGTAEAALAYWQRRTDAKIGDREAFEGVIENLVKHARKVRK
ncbi:hypothetical protein C8A05DRAFT_11479 [Staphylotrichum tortipilum]|uniref:Uncharacterized protein n=1 Tax=Staphylotrichum tortipilum TaxID=2831512 RepID=A0AAN6RYF8_9PEZI|nr:hypothetical protein C8A05DRAFT_11479 [Staphylotrichum longicolle]